MKRTGYMAALLGLVAVSALAASALAGSTAKVAFKASYAGKVAEKVSGQSVTAVANGSGKASVLGKSSIKGTVKGTTANPPCSPIAGPGTIKSSKGTLKVKVTNARGCAASEDDQNNISLSGTVKVKSGTGKLKKAKGSFHFSGQYNRSNGAFKVKLTGSLSY